MPTDASKAGAAYDWAGHVMQLVHHAALLLEQGLLCSREYRLVWNEAPIPLTASEGTPLAKTCELPPDYWGVVPAQYLTGPDGETWDWDYVSEVLSGVGLRVRVLEPRPFDALAFYTALLLEKDGSFVERSLLDQTSAEAVESSDLQGAEGKTQGDATTLTFSDQQWIACRLREIHRERYGDPWKTDGRDGQIDEDTDGAPGDGDSEGAKSPPRRPTARAFQAWQIANLLNISSQTEIAAVMSQNGVRTAQGQVSRWLRRVEEWRIAGGAVPTLDQKRETAAPFDPSILDMGERTDGRTPRQRHRASEDE